MPHFLTPEVHKWLDEDLPPWVMEPGAVQARNAKDVLLVVLGRCEEEYSATWPINYATSNHLLKTVPAILDLLKACNEKKSYAEIRELNEFHIDMRQISDAQTLASDEGIIQITLASIRDKIDVYFKTRPQLPIFEAPHASDEVRKFISDLKLPKLSPAAPLPALLLHNLRNCSPAHAERLRKLADAKDLVKFLCNTSGSGKTRMLCEGLTRCWGFYFTARSGDGIGSNDIFALLGEFVYLGHLRDLPPHDFQDTLEQNCNYVHHRFCQLLLSRVLILQLFLQGAAAQPGGITEEHREQWFLIQAAPLTLLGEDVFEQMSKSLTLRMDLDNLVTKIHEVGIDIAALLGHAINDMLCVIDEAQYMAHMLESKFMSADGDTPRPVLRELILAWRGFMPITVSGTGLSMSDIEIILGSAVSKELVTSHVVITDTGAFDGRDDQRAYVEQYVPPGFLYTEAGQDLMLRMEYWLHGRHRFTASYVARLIAAGFKSPHRILNGYITGMTMYEPSDAIAHIEKEPAIQLIPVKSIGLDYKKLERDDALRHLIAAVIFDYIITGRPRVLGADNEKLVEFGVARFVDTRDIKADEPLALLAVSNHYSQNSAWTHEYFLNERITPDSNAIRGIGMDPLAAFLLDRPLFHRSAHLVALKRVNGRLQIHFVDLSSPLKGTTYRHGHSPQTSTEFADWVFDPDRIPFCFPPYLVGPDLALALLLDDGTLLWVLGQVKHNTKKYMPPGDCKAALRTTIPEFLLTQRQTVADTTKSSAAERKEKRKKQKEKEKEQETRVTKDTVVYERILQNLDHLDHRTAMAGTHSVLHVLISHPATPHVLAEDVEDEGDHPVVIVALDDLTKSDATKKILDCLTHNLLLKEKEDLKRKREAEPKVVTEVTVRYKRCRTEA